MVAQAVAKMPRPKKDPNAPKMGITKIEAELLEQARHALSLVRKRLPPDKAASYGLQNYLSDCLRKSPLPDDFAAFIRSESKKLGR